MRPPSADPLASPAFGGPPADFRSKTLTLCEAGHSWVRLHHRQFGPIHFSRLACSRWDPTDGAGALCLAQTLAGAVLERFGDQLRSDGPFLTNTEVTEFVVTRVSFVSPPVVADIRNEHLFEVGADAQLFSGSYERSRAWSLAFMRHPQKPAGLLYNSRHNPAQTNLVLFKRRGMLEGKLGKTVPLRKHPKFRRMLEELHLGIAPAPVPPSDHDDPS